MSDLFRELLRDHLSAITAVVVGMLILVLLSLVRLSKRARAGTEDDVGEAGVDSLASDVVDLTSPPPRPDLRRSFARARAALRRAFPGGRGQYRRPWVLVVGPAAAGKTTLMAEAGLGMPFGQPWQQSAPDHPGVNWWALDGGVVLDVAGEDLLRPDGMTSDESEWRAILSRIRRARRRRPIDGVVLTIPAHHLLDDRKPVAQRLAEAARRGALLGRKLAEAGATLGMRFPVYLLISQCDRIPGFTGLIDRDQAGSRHQIFGWSNPLAPDAPYSGAWVDRAFTSIRAEIDAFQLARLARSNSGPRSTSEDFVLFPRRFTELLRPLKILTNQLFAPSAESETLPLRGIYFCARAGTDDQPGDGAGEEVFVHDLFEEKVFPEAAIARPAERRSRRASQWRAAWVGVTLLAVLWAGLGQRVGVDKALAVARTTAPLADTIARNQGSTLEVGQLLDAGSAVESYDLRSWLLPSSLLSRLPHHLDSAVERGFRKGAFVPFLAALQRATESLILTSEPGTVSSGQDVLAISSYPEFQRLYRFSQDLEQLDGSIAGYQRFAAGSATSSPRLEDFNQLSVAVVGRKLQPRGPGPARYYGARLRQVGAQAFDHQHAQYDRRLEQKVLGLADRLFEALFANNPLLLDLDETLVEWVDLGPKWAAGNPQAKRYRNLFATLNRVERRLQLPELQWVAADHLDLGLRFNEILRRVHDSPFLGPDVARQLKARAVAGFGELQRSIAIYETGSGGPLLTRQDETWVLTPPVEGVRTALAGVLGQPFMRARCQPRPVERSATGRILFWRAASLEEAVALYASYGNWDGESDLPPPLEASAPEVTAWAVADNILCRVREAQELQFPARGTDPKVLEESVKAQVDNLQAVEGSLSDLLAALGELGQRAEQTRLAQLLRDQRSHILEQLSALLASQGLYRPLNAGFGWWQGSAAPGLAAFGAADGKELSAYLDVQREIIQRFATQYAAVVLTAFESSGQAPLERQSPEAAAWIDIAGQLAAYDDMKAGNAVAELEALIATTALDAPPEVFDLYGCFGDRLPTARIPAGGYFQARRQTLLDSLVLRCRQLADLRGHELYVRLGGVFNDRLWGKFPFASADARDDATVDDLKAFFSTDFEKARVLIGNLPNPSPAFGSTREAVQDFIEDMESARLFFASFLAPEAKSGTPIYDLKVRFRIERRREQGANQIISWLLSIGEPATGDGPSANGEKLIDLLSTRSVNPAPAPGEPESPDGRWAYGQPVTLAFRWATGSPFSPFAPASTVAPQRWSLDGRTLLYKFREPWSLLRLLVMEGAPVEEFPGLRDPNPETVKLSIVTVSDDRPEPRAVADVYLRITLLSPDEGKELRLPVFYRLEAPLTTSPSVAPPALTDTSEAEPASTVAEADEPNDAASEPEPATGDVAPAESESDGS